MSRSQKTNHLLNHAVPRHNSSTTYFPKRTENEQATAHRPELYVDLDNSSNFEHMYPPSSTSHSNRTRENRTRENRGSIYLDLDVDLNVDFNINLDIT